MKIRRMVAVGSGTASLLLSSVVVTTIASAAVHTKQQIFTISLSANGAITSVNQANYQSDGTKNESALAPKSVAGKLPVSMQLSYVYRGKTGTNLSHIQGKSGAVEIDVTVRNMTQRQTIWTEPANSYGSTGRSYPSIVAEPITVLLSASVPQHSFGTLTAPPSGISAQSSSAAGVIGATSDGQPLVQWGSILAPPVLGGTSTFRLRETTQSFKLPTFTLVANPGIVTDASLGGVLSQASPQSIDQRLLAQNAHTYQLLQKLMNNTNSAADVVRAVHDLLHGRATEQTKFAAASLLTSDATISGLITKLNTNLKRQQDVVAQVFGTQAADLKAQLATSQHNVDCLISGSGCQSPRIRIAHQRSPRGSGLAACTFVTNIGSQSSIISLINAFATSAIAEADATSTCAGRIQQQTTDLYNALENDFASSSSAFSDVSAALSTTVADAAAIWSPTGWTGIAQTDLASIAQAIDALAGDVQSTTALSPSSSPGATQQTVAADLQSLTSLHGGASTATSTVAADLSVIGAAVSAAQSSLTSAESDLATLKSSIDAAGAAVSTEYNSDGTSGNSQHLASSLETLVQQICAADVQSALAETSSTADALSISLTGHDCAVATQTSPPPPTLGSLEAMALTNVSDWKTVSDANLSAALQAVSQDVAGLDTGLSSMSAALTSTETDVVTLQAAMTNLGAGVSTTTSDEALAATALLAQVTTLQNDATALCSGTCWDSVSGTVSSSSLGSVPKLTSDLQHYFVDINSADTQRIGNSLSALKTTALSEIAGLAPTTGTLDQALSNLMNSSNGSDQAFTGAQSQGDANAQAIQQGFDSTTNTLTNHLDRTTTQVIAELGSVVTIAQRELSGEKVSLDQQFKKVLKLLGFQPNMKPTGSGLLKVLNFGTVQASAAEAKLLATASSSSASSQQNHRSQVGLQMQLSELQQGLAQVSQNPQQIYVFELR